jgi:hypothetical protein
MPTREALDLVVRSFRVVTELSDLEPNRPQVSLGCGYPEPIVREVARIWAVEFVETLWLADDLQGDRVLYSATYHRDGVTVSLQGSRPATAEDARRLGDAQAWRKQETIPGELAAEMMEAK